MNALLYIFYELGLQEGKLSLLHPLTHPPTHPPTHPTPDEADRDGDGVINEEEFFRVMRKRGNAPLDVRTFVVGWVGGWVGGLALLFHAFGGLSHTHISTTTGLGQRRRVLKTRRSCLLAREGSEKRRKEKGNRECLLVCVCKVL